MVSGKTLFWTGLTCLTLGAAGGHYVPKLYFPSSDIAAVFHRPQTNEIFVSETTDLPFWLGSARVKSTFKPDSAPSLDYSHVQQLKEDGWSIYKLDNLQTEPLH